MDSSGVLNPISRCRSCDCGSIETFFNLGDQPLANSLLEGPAVEERFYPLSLSCCPECGLVQLNHTVDPSVLFSKYLWVTSTSLTARQYAERFSDMVVEASKGSRRPPFVLEAASNDGTFLEPFLSRGWQVLGVDPAENIARRATDEGTPTLCAFFGSDTGRTIKSKYGAPRVVVARNVLPHVADLHDFMEGLHHVTIPDGLVVVEVHWAWKIFQELHYDSIYHEHLCYFTLSALERLFARHGLFIFDVKHSPISGGSLVCFASPHSRPVSERVTEVKEIEKGGGATRIAGWKHFAERSKRHRCLFFEILDRKEVKEGRTVGYGASARSSTLLNYCGLNTDTITTIADQNPFKHNLYTPGTHIPINSPEEVFKKRPDTAVVLAWNFYDEITAVMKERYGFRGTIITPLPFTPRMVAPEVLHG